MAKRGLKNLKILIFACSAVGDYVGWLFRGGITIGEFYINDTIVWGLALLRAYELEEKIANYPFRLFLERNNKS